MTTPAPVEVPALVSSEAVLSPTADLSFRNESYATSESNLSLWGNSGGASLEAQQFLPEVELGTGGGAQVTDRRQARRAQTGLDPAKSIAQLYSEGVFSPPSLEDITFYSQRQSDLLYRFNQDGYTIHEYPAGFHRGDRDAASLYQFAGDAGRAREAGGENGIDRLAEGEAPRIKVVYRDTSIDVNAKQQAPDFIVGRNGTIKILNNPEENSHREIIVEVEREKGQIGDPTAEQSMAVGALVDYLTKRIQAQHPDSSEGGVAVDDKQGLVPDDTRSSSSIMPEPESSLPPATQDQIQDMNRVSGSGSGSMSPSEARDTFPPGEVPRLPSESDQLAAVKNVVAGFESRGQREPYYAVQPRGERGWSVGRFGLTSFGFFNWLFGLSDEDLEEIEELEEKGTVDKNKKGILAKGSAKRLRAARDAFKNRGKTDDPDALELIGFMRKMNEGKEPISKDEIDKYLPKELQELVAADQISRFAQRSAEENQGKVDIGTIALAMHLGQYPSDEDLGKAENQSLMKAAGTAYPLALQAVMKPDAPVEWKESDGKVHGNPNDYFFTQFQNAKWNPNGPSRSNNCGPASLAMALRAFGKDEASDPEALIRKTRIAMTGNADKSRKTGNDQVYRGATSCGMNAEHVQTMGDLEQSLAEGKMVVALGNPSTYGKRLSNNEYSYYNGMHYILVAGMTKSESGERRFVVNDPLSRVGSMTISAHEMEEYVRAGARQGYRAGVAVWT